MDSIIFQSAIALSVFVFFAPLRLKYFIILLPFLAIMSLSSVWAIDVLATNQTKTFTLTLNVAEKLLSFWSYTPHLIIDQLSALFILMVNVVSIGAIIYAYAYLQKYLHLKSKVQISIHYLCFFLLHLSLILLVSLRDGFMFLFAWELMSLSSFVLVAFNGENPNITKIAVNYLIQMHFGFLFILAGFLLADKETGTWGFDALTLYFSSHNNLPLFLLFFVGFSIKAGLIPFHSWLPHAHPAAPAYVSGMMSGVMIKMGIYGILRVLTSIQFQLFEISMIMMVLALITILSSISMAVFQKDIKKILAYSSIENIGIIYLGISLSLLGKATNLPALVALGMIGAIFHMLNHSLYKSMLFMLAGSIEKVTGTRNINQLGGLARGMPYTAAFFLIGSLSLCALPPLNGFISEFLIYEGIFKGIASANFIVSITSIFAVIVLGLAGGICIYAMTKAFGLSFLGSNRKNYNHPVHEPSKLMLVPAIINTLLMIIIGVAPMIIMPFLQNTLTLFTYIPLSQTDYQENIQIFQKFSIISLVLVALFILVLIIRFIQQRKVKITQDATWGCGYNALTPKHQYTSNSYAASLKNIVSPLLKERKNFYSYKEDEIFPLKRKYNTHVQDRLEELIIIKPVKYLMSKLSKLGQAQTGRIQHYLIYPFVFLIIIAMLTIFRAI